MCRGESGSESQARRTMRGPHEQSTDERSRKTASKGADWLRWLDFETLMENANRAQWQYIWTHGCMVKRP